MNELQAVIQNGRQLSLEFIEENLNKVNKGDLLNDYDSNCAFKSIEVQPPNAATPAKNGDA